MTAADMLAELIAALERDGVSLRFAELKDPTKDRLKQLRPVRGARGARLLPDGRIGRRRLRGSDRHRVGGLGRAGLTVRQPTGTVAGRRPVLVLDVAEAESIDEPAEDARAPTSSTCPSGASWPGTSRTRMIVASTRDRDGHPDADALDRDDLGEREGREHADHDQRRAR